VISYCVGPDMKLTLKEDECAENEKPIKCRYSMCTELGKSVTEYYEHEEPGKNNKDDNKNTGYIRSSYSIYHLSFIISIFTILYLL